MGDKRQWILQANMHWCNFRPIFACFVFICLLNLTSYGTAQDLNVQAAEIFLDKCHRCHGIEHEDGNDDFNILNAEFLKQSHVKPGQPDQSLIIERISSQDEPMPPVGEGTLTDQEKDVLRNWIQQGAQSLPVTSMIETGTELIRETCHKCHGLKRSGNPSFEILNSQLYQKETDEFVAHGRLADSTIWEKVDDGSMPKGKRKLNDEEKTAIRRWVLLGGQTSQVQDGQREWISLNHELKMIRDDLQSAKIEDRPFLRYFTLRNIHNNSTFSGDELRDHQMALSIVCNSLSNRNRIHPPTEVPGCHKALWRIDVRDYGWDSRMFSEHCGVERVSGWRLLCAKYPYGVDVTSSRSRELADLARQIDDLCSVAGEFPVLRADWFIYSSTQGELYNLMTGVPRNIQQLENRLGVDVAEDFRRGDLLRAAVKISGVSIGNRAMDRHEARQGGGYYWISYDFKNGGQRADLNRFPLGPAFHNNPYPTLAFEHDGGEIIYSLPNGLQAYALTDGTGNRLELGPSEVVKDALNTIGTGQVANGISCMRCHSAGMKTFSDEIFQNMTIGGEAYQFARTLFDEDDKLSQQLEKDSLEFQGALQKCVSKFDLSDEEFKRILVPEASPIGTVADRYLQPMNLTQVATEIDIDPASPSTKILFQSQPFLKAGLSGVSNGSNLQRIDWESDSQQRGSLYNQAVRLIGDYSPKTYLNPKVNELSRRYQEGK